MEVIVWIRVPATLPPTKNSGTHRVGGFLGPIAGLYVWKREKPLGVNLLNRLVYNNLRQMQSVSFLNKITPFLRHKHGVAVHKAF
jgi:hypothetical protein